MNREVPKATGQEMYMNYTYVIQFKSEFSDASALLKSLCKTLPLV